VLILPAIDLRGGQCVRLKQGDYAQETVFGADPAAMARRWIAAGAQLLHIVDLDGAREGRPVNGECVRRIVAAGVPCQLGGGLRTVADIETALGWGVHRVVLGTRALEDPDWFALVCREFPGKIVAGIDARDGRAATHGWLQVSEVPAVELARQIAVRCPIAAIVYTDIGRDGMLEGPNLDALAELQSGLPAPVIASGGVTTLEDVGQLARLHLAGCIVGRALYEGKLDLAQAIAAANNQAV
jgi:phosphoribosylformimino-5-aminoimidazole carboxamide ribotide isomerase